MHCIVEHVYHAPPTCQEIAGQLDSERRFEERLITENFGTSRLARVR
jgi:hypothetical protein